MEKTEQEMTAIEALKSIIEVTPGELGVTTILLLLAYLLYKKILQNDIDIKSIRTEKDSEVKELNNKIIDIQSNALKVIPDFTRALEDNTKALELHGKMVERLYDKIEKG